MEQTSNIKTWAKTYTLRTEEGYWLGYVILTSDGVFASVTDWGNFSYSWDQFGSDFRAFICRLDVGYFTRKMYSSITYIASGKKIEAACGRFAARILPALQEVLRDEVIEEQVAKLQESGIPIIEQ